MGGHPSCPVCGDASGAVIGEVRFADVWAALEGDLAVSFDRDVKDRLSPAEHVRTYACPTCGLQYHWPAVAGDPAFYEALSAAPSYYEERRWEFDVIADALRPGRRVVDVGAGMGQFLAIARDAGCEVLAVEPNPRARAALDRAGIAYVDPDAFPLGWADLVTGFQVVEHVEDPVALLRTMRELTNPDGRVMVSVPAVGRLGGAHEDPLDLPPHHLTRWPQEALRSVPAKAGLQFVRSWQQPADRSQTRAHARASLPGVFGRVLGRATASARVHAALSRTDLLQRWGAWGHTVLVEYRPDTP